MPTHNITCCAKQEVMLSRQGPVASCPLAVEGHPSPAIIAHCCSAGRWEEIAWQNGGREMTSIPGLMTLLLVQLGSGVIMLDDALAFIQNSVVQPLADREVIHKRIQNKMPCLAKIDQALMGTLGGKKPLQIFLLHHSHSGRACQTEYVRYRVG